jgi:hypothetical protein
MRRPSGRGGHQQVLHGSSGDSRGQRRGSPSGGRDGLKRHACSASRPLVNPCRRSTHSSRGRSEVRWCVGRLELVCCLEGSVQEQEGYRRCSVRAHRWASHYFFVPGPPWCARFSIFTGFFFKSGWWWHGEHLVMNESSNGNHGEPRAPPHTLHPTISSNFCYLRKFMDGICIFFHGDYWVVPVLVAELWLLNTTHFTNELALANMWAFWLQ